MLAVYRQFQIVRRVTGSLMWPHPLGNRGTAKVWTSEDLRRLPLACIARQQSLAATMATVDSLVLAVWAGPGCIRLSTVQASRRLSRDLSNKCFSSPTISEKVRAISILIMFEDCTRHIELFLTGRLTFSLSCLTLKGLRVEITWNNSSNGLINRKSYHTAFTWFYNNMSCKCCFTLCGWSHKRAQLQSRLMLEFDMLRPAMPTKAISVGLQWS